MVFGSRKASTPLRDSMKASMSFVDTFDAFAVDGDGARRGDSPLNQALTRSNSPTNDPPFPLSAR